LKTKKKTENYLCPDENRLNKIPLLICENVDVSEKELEECKQILENLRQRLQSSSSQFLGKDS